MGGISIILWLLWIPIRWRLELQDAHSWTKIETSQYRRTIYGCSKDKRERKKSKYIWLMDLSKQNRKVNNTAGSVARGETAGVWHVPKAFGHWWGPPPIPEAAVTVSSTPTFYNRKQRPREVMGFALHQSRVATGMRTDGLLNAILLPSPLRYYFRIWDSRQGKGRTHRARISLIVSFFILLNF